MGNRDQNQLINILKESAEQRQLINPPRQPFETDERASLRSANPFKKFTEAELARHYDLSPWTIRRFRLQEGMPCIPLGGRFFYNLNSVDRWFAEREQKGTGCIIAEPQTTGTIREIR